MRKGFTLIELVVVVFILAILAITAVPRIISLGEMRLDMALQKVVSDLKYAREFAMNHNCRSEVVFAPRTETYTVYENSSGSWQIARDPTTGDNFIVELNTGNYKGVVIVSAAFDHSTLIEFDSIGAPYLSLKAPLETIGVVVIEGGGKQKSIKVAPITGRIYITN